MSERQTCALASAFVTELLGSDCEIQSSEFLNSLGRLSETGHEHRLGTILEKHGLQASIETSYVNVGLPDLHPVLRFQDVLAGFEKAGKVRQMLMQDHNFEDFRVFWQHLQKHRGEHPVFQQHGHHLEHCIPMFLHADEGTGQKRKGLMVLQVQPVLAQGSRRAEDVNLSGSTFMTRMLYSVMSGRLYSKKKAVLDKLLEHWAEDFTTYFYSGIRVVIDGKTTRVYPIVLGLKGDWQGLIKLGKLNRSFLRDSPQKDCPPGICHLCQAGRAGFPWNKFDSRAEWLVDPHALDDEPWRQPSPLLRIPCDVKARFYMIDIFHTCHKGIMGDFAASALDPWYCS